MVLGLWSQHTTSASLPLSFPQLSCYVEQWDYIKDHMKTPYNLSPQHPSISMLQYS